MIDYLIITFIASEHKAVCRRFSDAVNDVKIVSNTTGDPLVLSLITNDEKKVEVVIARTPGPGNLIAQDTTQTLIGRFAPKIVLAIGIAGAVPSNDIFLGDVIFAREILNFTVSAETETGTESTVPSEYVPNSIKQFVANLATHDFIQWETVADTLTRPAVINDELNWSDDTDWNIKLNRALQAHFDRQLPSLLDGVIASSDQLIKSVQSMKQRLVADRRILANDMESAGVAKACEKAQVPLLVTRSISDIVGYPRTDDWKEYACEVVAICALELVKADIIGTIRSQDTTDRSKSSNSTTSVIDDLENVLIKIQSNSSDRSLLCHSAFELFQTLPISLQRTIAPKFFDTLDRPMKYIGDKKLVLDVASACVDCFEDAEIDVQRAECIARAKICGITWVYQRTGQIDLAELEATKSINISSSIGSNKNLAFGKKCSGRLKRVRAETEADSTVKNNLLQESEAFLQDAISMFSELGEFGPFHSEIGDCYSLLGRTQLYAGKIHDAQISATRAAQLVDVDSKDYLDLRILVGDLYEASGNFASALLAYNEVIESMLDEGYQTSEIVARAHRQKGLVLLRTGDWKNASAEFETAAQIWLNFDELHVAADAKWLEIEAKRILDIRTRKLLERETTNTRVRCRAVQMYLDNSANQRQNVVAQRIRSDDIVWKKLIKKAEQEIALEDSKTP